MKRILHLLLGALVMLAGVEVLLRVLPVSTATNTGYHTHPDILTYPAHHQWTVSSGWDLRDVQRMRANNLGFAAQHDFTSGADAIGLVGDSYVEASMLPMGQRPAAQLERSLAGRRPVFAMGGPGSSLLDYAVRIRWAREALGVRDFVVLMEHTDASQTLCSSGNVHARCLDPMQLKAVWQRQPPSGPFKQLLRQSALAQYLVSQLKLDMARMKSRDFWKTGAPAETGFAGHGADPGAIPVLNALQQRVINTAVDQFVLELSGLHDLRLFFIIDMNRRNLAPGVSTLDESYHVAQRLQAAGYPVLRAEPIYREHMNTSSLRLDMGPHDAHLNSLGVRLLMSAAARTLQQHDFIRIKSRGN